MSWDKRKDDLREDVIRQTNKRKKTGRWCRGKVGTEHVTEIVVNHNWSVKTTCGWQALYHYRSWDGRDKELVRWHYSCRHSLKCTNCGKYVVYFLKSDMCPDYSPLEEMGG